MKINELDKLLTSSIKQYGSLREVVWSKIAGIIDGEEAGKLLLYLPKKYIIYKNISISSNISKELSDDFVPVVYGKVLSVFTRNNGIFYKVLDLKSDYTFNVYFKKTKGQKKPKIDHSYYFIGKINITAEKNTNEGKSPVNIMMFFPQFKETHGTYLEAVYAKLSNYYTSYMRDALKKILGEMSNIYIFTREEFQLNRYSVKSLFTHIHLLTSSVNQSTLKEYKNILKLFEYTCFFYKLSVIKNVTIGTSKKQKYLCKLNIKLTKCQVNAIRGISLNLSKEEKTINFLQGDVGTGKTLVAFVTIQKTLINGYNACFMSPTGILANQHYENFKKFFPEVSAFILESGYKNKEYLATFQKIINSQIPTVFFGTHNLLYEIIPNTQYIVIDEQHKFGMEQRKILMDYYPTADILFLSATPIPRTLFLLQNRQMELFTLRINPFPRNVSTYIVNSREKVISKVILASKHSKVLWINGAIEESDHRKGVKATYEFLKSLNLDVYLIHGQLKDEEKISILENFHRGILVATTAVETGMDLPNLPLIIIEEAQNFGLATLHQLRGRVGRQGQDSECILIDEQEGDRLQILVDTNDGLKIAEIDLLQRGYGSFFQKKQWGFDNFKSGKLNTKLFQYASKLVEKQEYNKEVMEIFSKFFLKIEDVNY